MTLDTKWKASLTISLRSPCLVYKMMLNSDLFVGTEQGRSRVGSPAMVSDSLMRRVLRNRTPGWESRFQHREID